MYALETLKQIAGNIPLAKMEEAMGCPECGSWTNTPGEKKECSHEVGWRPTLGGIRCANCSSKSTAGEL
jgi:DNA-directed RNA polymerase subunit RPC12/RpoP